MYKRINAEQYRMVMIVGDLHGCYDLLMSELDAVGFDKEQDLLIGVGDLVDRGPKSLDCLDLINQPWFTTVAGNHEWLMYDALCSNSFNAGYNWDMNGGTWFWNQLDHVQQQLCRLLAAKVPDLPLVIELVTGDGTVVVAHADYPHASYEFGRPVTKDQATWERGRTKAIFDGHISAGYIKGADLFVFGHTPVKQPASTQNQNGNVIYIDTGAFKTGSLTLLRVV